MTYEELVKLARDVMKNAYAPYSKFRVGAAVLTDSGKVYTGVNVENSSFGATNCAERTAIFKAISEGERKLKVIAIASDLKDYIYPCGICRQVMGEFADDDTIVVCSDHEGKIIMKKIKEIMPNFFNF